MRTSKVKPKKKFIYKPTVIEASFLRKGQIDKRVIRKEYRTQIGHDEWYERNAGGYWGEYSPNPMFTSRNSHKQTNKK